MIRFGYRPYKRVFMASLESGENFGRMNNHMVCIRRLIGKCSVEISRAINNEEERENNAIT